MAKEMMDRQGLYEYVARKRTEAIESGNSELRRFLDRAVREAEARLIEIEERAMGLAL